MAHSIASRSSRTHLHGTNRFDQYRRRRPHRFKSHHGIRPAGYLRPGAQRQGTIDKIEPVLSPKYFTVQHDRGRSEHSQRKRFLAVAPIVAARIFAVPIALISIVDEDRIWFKSHHGIDISEIDREPELCASAILRDVPTIVTDAKIDPRTLSNSLVTGSFGRGSTRLLLCTPQTALIWALYASSIKSRARSRKLKLPRCNPWQQSSWTNWNFG
jgi:hypothetical protein